MPVPAGKRGVYSTYDEYDYIVVGSGAGGGPLACNLAEAPQGYRVALLEAGLDPAAKVGSTSFYNTSVPGLHPRATEDASFSWDFGVQHYEDRGQQAKDSKYDIPKGQKDIFYPRAAALGGCTSHHAMITIYPFRADWDNIQSLTNDPTWSADSMRGYFTRMEDCQYLPGNGLAGKVDPESGHGFGGWLPLSMTDPTLAINDPALIKILLHAFLTAFVDAFVPPAAKQKLATQVDATQKALDLAVNELLTAGQRASAFQPNTIRPMYEQLRADIAAWQKTRPKKRSQTITPDELIRLYADADVLLQLLPLARAWLDPNRNFHQDSARFGPYSPPASILYGVRKGVRERILEVRARYPDRLHLFSGALVTKVILEKLNAAGEPGLRAVGVNYYQQAGIYKATPKPVVNKAQLKELRVHGNGEVILAGGTFNTPQLLMLSGIGPEDVLKSANVPVQCKLPGVGQNLQDRYEIAVIAEYPATPNFTGFRVLQGSTFFAPGDSCSADQPATHYPSTPDTAIRDWTNHRGVYATNGVVLAILKKSTNAENDTPDLFLFGLPGTFKGYYRGYSCDTQSDLVKPGTRVENHRRFTWAILKARTKNDQGYVKLKNNDPLERPIINFKYFKESALKDANGVVNDDWVKDRDALVEAIVLAQQLITSGYSDEKNSVLPKPAIIWPPQDTLANPAALQQFVLDEAWGHHACGTCKIGKLSDPTSVLDGDFRVRGVKNLRVVDASVFPKIPGFFIVTSIYMISEKASDVILQSRQVIDECTKAPARVQSKLKPWPTAPG
jgi:choline dehydrogenase